MMTDPEGFVELWLGPSLQVFKDDLQEEGYVIEEHDTQYVENEFYLEYKILFNHGMGVRLVVQGCVNGTTGLMMTHPTSRGAVTPEWVSDQIQISDGNDRQLFLAGLLRLAGNILPD